MRRKKKRKKKKLFSLILLLVILGISSGYAVLSTALSVYTNTNVKNNKWDIKFNNIRVNKNSIDLGIIPTFDEINNTISLSFDLYIPGNFYEFTVDVVNEGTIDAMIESIGVINGLTSEQEKYLRYTIEYENKEKIEPTQIIPKGEFVRIRIRVEYRTDILPEDLPTSNKKINLVFKINCIQKSKVAYPVRDNGVLYLEANGDINAIGTIVSLGDQQFYTVGANETTVSLFSMYNLYVGSECNGLNCTRYGKEATGLQDPNMKGYQAGVAITSGGTPFSDEEQKGETVVSYSGSYAEMYTKDYKKLLEKNYGIEIDRVRSVSRSDLTNQNTFACESASSCANTYPWVFSTSYWMLEEFDTLRVFTVLNSGSYGGIVYNEGRMGVRPIIEVSKSYFR